MTTERTLRDIAREAYMTARYGSSVNRPTMSHDQMDIADAVAVAVLEEVESKARQRIEGADAAREIAPLYHLMPMLRDALALLRGRGARAQEPPSLLTASAGASPSMEQEDKAFARSGRPSLIDALTNATDDMCHCGHSRDWHFYGEQNCFARGGDCQCIRFDLKLASSAPQVDAQEKT